MVACQWRFTMITENDMDEFIIYCTEEQTKKALALGAKIKTVMSKYNATNANKNCEQGKESFDEYLKKGIIFLSNGFSAKAYSIPTAEQMIGWLESGRIDHIDIFKHANMWRFDIFCTWDRRLHCEPSHFYSRPEATLAAIDAVLEYLSSKNG